MINSANRAINQVLAYFVSHPERLIVEYALRDIRKPIGVSEWQTRLTASLPKELQSITYHRTIGRVAAMTALRRDNVRSTGTSLEHPPPASLLPSAFV
jgi:hypothetical protein